MKTKIFKLFVTAILMASLTACMGKRAQQAESNYQVNYGGYLANQTDCFVHNKHAVEFIPDGATAPVKMEFAAGDCDGVEKPQHGGEYVAQTETALINAGGNVAAATIGAIANYEISENDNDTRRRLAELQNEREANENAVLLEAIGSNQALTESVIEQNESLADLIDSLSVEDETETDVEPDTGL